MGKGDKAATAVATGAKVWEIMKDGKPLSSAQSAMAHAVPKGRSPSDPQYSGTYSNREVVTFGGTDWYGFTVIDGKLRCSFRHGGRIKGVAGLFVANFNISDNGTYVRAFGQCHVRAVLSGAPVKVGRSGEDPIWAIEIVVTAQHGQKIGSLVRDSWNITARGDGRCIVR